MKDGYLAALKKELVDRRDFLAGEDIQTIYFGGGTPSLLSPNEIQSVIECIRQNFTVATEPEITVEANPDDLSATYIEHLSETDANRLSIGIQSFDDGYLKMMNRRHNAQQAIDAVKQSQSCGFKNISVDLIYGLPGLAHDMWLKQLQTVEKLNVQHLSAYHLSYEEGTAFSLKLKQKKLSEVSEDESLEQFETLTQWAKETGFEHYEISNFARQGFRSRHNSSYWNRTKYLGVGPAAHSYNQTSRCWNVSDVQKYISGIGNGICVSEEEILTQADIFNDYVITALRTSDGIDLNYLEKEHPRQMVDYLKKQAESFLRSNKLEIASNRLKLTHDGIFISDEIMEALIYLE